MPVPDDVVRGKMWVGNTKGCWKDSGYHGYAMCPSCPQGMGSALDQPAFLEYIDTLQDPYRVIGQCVLCQAQVTITGDLDNLDDWPSPVRQCIC